MESTREWEQRMAREKAAIEEQLERSLDEEQRDQLQRLLMKAMIESGFENPLHKYAIEIAAGIARISLREREEVA